MVLLYFLRQFYLRFFFLFAALLFVLTSADMLMRLATLPSVTFIPNIFLCMLPLIAIFAIPIASCLAVQTTVGELYASNAILLLKFLSSTKRALHKALFIFAFSLLIPYAVLIFEWAPRSYANAKQLIITFATEHLSSLDPGIFHHPTDDFSIFFKQKKQYLIAEGKEATKFFDLLLVMRAEDHEYMMSAKEGELVDNMLSLKDGTMYNERDGKKYIASFGQTEINIDQLTGPKPGVGKEEKIEDLQTKFLGWDELQAIKNNHPKAAVEFHVRIVRIIWQLLIPFLGLVGLVRFGTPLRYNLMVSVAWTGGLVIFSYLLLSIAGAFWKNGLMALVLLYGISGVTFTIIQDLYRKYW